MIVNNQLPPQKGLLSDICVGSLRFASQIAIGVITELINQYTLTP